MLGQVIPASGFGGKLGDEVLEALFGLLGVCFETG
jgi:hypothetical protein